MSTAQEVIESAFEQRSDPQVAGTPGLRDAVTEVMEQLNAGTLRVAEPGGGDWVVHQWVKKAVLLSFLLQENQVIDSGDTR
ncbi:MAG: 2,3,4,5-tetrahydropyridine-2,6-dicarboxylate N-succinyltransferase, partial [Proteobacteria bacterium]|nr:2,3,4,5-tetrahydropyridine-2,6-dicarboxylate N-succinyltransferase [Pseudomonadota bacterium]